MLDVMRSAGIRLEIMYAFKKTGFLLTEENESMVSEQDIIEWDEAIDEYFSLEDSDANH